MSAPSEFKINLDELDFYDALTRFVEDQSIKAAAEDSARGRALGFTMAMLQRRFASSMYAVRRSLERMKEKREKILADPEGYRQDADQQTSARRLRRPARGRTAGDCFCNWKTSLPPYDPAALREEITELGKLIQQGGGSGKTRGRIQSSSDCGKSSRSTASSTILR